jgi:hypothetical protein
MTTTFAEGAEGVRATIARFTQALDDGTWTFHRRTVS